MLFTGYKTDEDREDDQKAEFDDYFKDVAIKKGDKYWNNGVGKMEVSYGSVSITGLWITQQVNLFCCNYFLVID